MRVLDRAGFSKDIIVSIFIIIIFKKKIYEFKDRSEHEYFKVFFPL